MTMPVLCGVDIGGAFTDFAFTVEGRLHVRKVLSTPRDPAQAMLAGPLSTMRPLAAGTAPARRVRA